uniref:Uncharacterized protein n=1 Tax=Brugia timori TaxID=42155 RepID=A0A0R3RBA9_9BILA
MNLSDIAALHTTNSCQMQMIERKLTINRWHSLLLTDMTTYSFLTWPTGTSLLS